MLDIAGLPTECEIQSLEIALLPDKIVRDVDQSLINKAASIYDSLCQRTNLTKHRRGRIYRRDSS